MKTNFKHPKRRLRTLKSPIKKQNSKQKQKKKVDFILVKSYFEKSEELTHMQKWGQIKTMSQQNEKSP